MSLSCPSREEIATRCLAALLSDPNYNGESGDAGPLAVKYADALLAALSKRSPEVAEAKVEVAAGIDKPADARPTRVKITKARSSCIAVGNIYEVKKWDGENPVITCCHNTSHHVNAESGDEWEPAPASTPPAVTLDEAVEALRSVLMYHHASNPHGYATVTRALAILARHDAAKVSK